MDLSLRKDLAFQRYQTTSGEMIAAYTLGENRFTLVQDDAAILLGRILAGEDRDELMNGIQNKYGPNAKKEASEFLDGALPLFFDSSEPNNYTRLQGRHGTEPDLNNAEEDGFYGFCATEGIFTTSAWELSYACNLRCAHCYNPHHTVHDQMDTGMWLDLLDQAREMGLLRLCLTGGEVGVYSGFWEILAKTRRLNLAVDVLTNGLVFADPYMAKNLAGLFPRSVQCSLYGATAMTHETLTRVPGSWGKTIKCLENFADLGVPIVIKCPAMQANHHEIPEVVRIAEKLGAMLQVDVNITARNDGDAGPTEMRLNEEQLSWLFTQPDLPLYQGLERASRSGIQLRDPDDGVCGAGTNGLSVQPNGTVIPCLAFGISLGDLRRQSLRDIWQGEPLSAWRGKKRKDCSDCVACEIQSHCSFCPGISLIDTGHFLNKNPNDCRVAKVRAAVFEQLPANFSSNK